MYTYVVPLGGTLLDRLYRYICAAPKGMIFLAVLV